MKKFFAIAAVLTMAYGIRAESYLYWMLEDSPVQFAYAKLLAEGADGKTIGYLTMGNSSYEVVASAGPSFISLNPIYSMLPSGYDLTKLRFIVELYGTDQTVVASSYASYSALQEFIYSDMSTTGITPYHFTASIPEPSGGILMLFGFGLMALRRKRSL